MKRIIFVLFLVLVAGCKDKGYEVDGIRFWKFGATEDYLYSVRTLDVVEDSSLLIKSISVLGLEKYGIVMFSDKFDIPYAQLSKNIDHDGYYYAKYERDSIKSIPNNSLYSSQYIYDGTKCAIISEDFVKSKMMYPRETKIRTSTHTHEVEGNEAIVMNKFTSKNAFGMKADYVYKIWMTHNGGEWNDIDNWTMRRLVIEISSTGEQFVYD